MKQLNTFIEEQQMVEAALLEHPLIDDCVVLVRKGEISRRELVAYVVSSGLFSLEQVESHLRSRVSAVMMPIAYIPVSTLPVTELGQVDEQALIDLEAINSDLVERWEERLQSVPEVEQVAVIVEESNEKIPALHLSDLLPDQGRRVDNLNSDKSLEVAAQVLQESESKALAISYGETSRSQASHPTTLSAALLRTALEIPSEGILYLKADGSEIVQSYKALLNEAERILAGLRQLGLKPEDKVIFQINHNWDFIPAFWGCILGGFVPVPISTASI